MKKVVLFMDLVSMVGLLIYNLKMAHGDLRFGREMGDMAYFYLLALGSVIAVVSLALKYMGILKKGTLLATVFTLGLFLFLLYFSSFGRGPDYPWDGSF